jgi:hypothetical protein
MKLVSFYTDHYQEMADIVIPRWKVYCKTNNMDCEFFKLPQIGSRVDFCWDKIELCRRVLDDADECLLWVDIDILPIKQKNLIWTEKPVGMCSDDNGLCTGVMILQNCDWTKKYLDTMLFLRDITSEKEQDINSINAGDQSCAKYLMGFTNINQNITVLPDNGLISHPHRDIDPHTIAVHYWANGGHENKLAALIKMKIDAENHQLL